MDNNTNIQFDDSYFSDEKATERQDDFHDIEIVAEGLERRKEMNKSGVRVKRVDYSDKGDHDYYVIGAFHKKCRKCEIIVDITFDTPWYRPRDGEQQWIEPPCTWKGRALPKEKK